MTTFLLNSNLWFRNKNGVIDNYFKNEIKRINKLSLLPKQNVSQKKY